MKNQIKNDLNNIKNSGQIVINTSISNNSESSEWQTEDLIEKTETSDFKNQKQLRLMLKS